MNSEVEKFETKEVEIEIYFDVVWRVKKILKNLSLHDKYKSELTRHFYFYKHAKKFFNLLKNQAKKTNYYVLFPYFLIDGKYFIEKNRDTALFIKNNEWGIFKKNKLDNFINKIKKQDNSILNKKGLIGFQINCTNDIEKAIYFYNSRFIVKLPKMNNI